MKTYSVVKYDGLANPNKSQRDLQNADLTRPSEETRLVNLEKTRQELNVSVSKKIEPAFVTSVAHKSQKDIQYVRYTPQNLNPHQQSQQRIIQVSTVQEDPLEPPRFKHKRIMRPHGSPPPQINRSPPRKLTNKDMQDWKVPPCISNWKNAKGFTIPLHMRLQADGRGMQDNSINEKFSSFTDSLYTAEKQARKEVEERSKIQETIKMALAMKKEKEIKQAATLARAEKAGLMASSISKFNSELRKDTEDISGKKRSREEKDLEEAKKERDDLRYQRKREIERDRRMEVAGKKKSKTTRDEERDISEKIALGQAQPTSREAMFDQRLFNQASGLDSGFGEEDDYNLYDKPLFADRTAASIYKNVKEVNDDDDNDQQADQGAEAKQTGGQKPNRGFEGTDYTKGARAKPVEFEKRLLGEDNAFSQAGLHDGSQPNKRQKQ
eukprot:403360736